MTPRRPRPLAFALALFMLSVPATVLAHAELDNVTPADKSSVATPPSEVVMTFTEPLNPAKSSIRLVDNSGKLVAEGSTVDASDPKTMRLALPPALPIGTYTARWTSASALDGDTSKRVLNLLRQSDWQFKPEQQLLVSAFRTRRGAEEFAELSRDRGATVAVVRAIKLGGAYVGLGQEAHPDGVSGPLVGPLDDPDRYQR